MRRRSFLHGMGVAGAVWGWSRPARSVQRETGVVAPGTPAPAAVKRAPRGVGTRADSPSAQLLAVGATLGLEVTRFERSHIVGSAAVPLVARGSGEEGAGKIAIDGAAIECRSRVVAARDRRDAFDVEATFRVTRGRLPNARVAVTLNLTGWSRDAYLLMPGAVYAGNRFASRHIPYPPLPTEPSDIGPHVPPIVSDIPRLNNQAGESRLVLTATDVALPCIAVRVVGTAAGDRGFVLLCAPTTALGPVDLCVTENVDRSVATLSIGAPGVRPDVRYGLCNSRVPSTDRGAALDQGGTVTLRLRLLSFDCTTVQTLFDRCYEARRDRVGQPKVRHELPFSVARQLILDRLAADQWTDTPGLFATRAPTVIAAAALAAPTPSPQRESIFQTGGDGALGVGLPLMMAGGAAGRRRAAAVVDFQLGGQASSGLFRAASNGVTWWDEGDGQPPAVAREGQSGGASSVKASTKGNDPRPWRGRHWTHVGRNAEALYLACKQALFLQRLDPSYRVSSRWRAGLGRCADAFVRLWSRHQQLGQYVNCQSGDIVVGGSTAGGLVPAALLLVGRLLETDSYKVYALATAEAFYTKFVRSGLTLGGAPAALQSPDSRSAAGLLESFVMLAEATGDEATWFGRATEVAHQLATWVLAWDVPLPEQSTLGKLGVGTTGAVLVSAQDKWALPGVPALSGEALFRLYRATGRVSYLELLRETAHNSSAYVDTEDRRPEVDTKAGWVAGRVPISDAMGAPGEVLPGTPAGAAQGSCLMASTELPSVYIQPDTGFLFVIDHVEARVKARTAAATTITVRNPTRFEAEVRFFSENDGDRSRGLGLFPMWGARTLTLGAGTTEDVEFPRAPT